MDRLTEWRGEHAAVVNHHENYIDRLAAYEDTGLSPKVCAEYKKFEDEAISKNVTFNRIVELMNADAAGRLVVSPLKPGDHVWINGLLGGHGEEYEITSVNCNIGSRKDVWFNAKLAGYDGWARCSFGLDQIGKRVFLTREEAEKPTEIENAAEEAQRMGISYGQHMYNRREQP